MQQKTVSVLIFKISKTEISEVACEQHNTEGAVLASSLMAAQGRKVLHGLPEFSGASFQIR
ncbi:hypothetical protein ACQP3J_30640, partial [Escherichia coli]